jgi:hypothetical protein
MKLLFAWFVAFLPACCTPAPQLKYVNDFHCYSLKWDLCPALSASPAQSYEIFYLSCMHAGFDINDQVEELIINENVYRYLMSNMHGYVCMEIDGIQKSCVIEWGADNLLSFTDFISFFADNLVALEQL